MKYLFKVGIAGLLLTGFAIKEANASLTWFSRANCVGNNESISFNPWGDHFLRTKSSHYIELAPGALVFIHCTDNLDPEFDVNAGDGCQNDTWRFESRSAAVHFLESNDGANWVTHGVHYEFTNAGEVLLGTTSATDCNLAINQFF